MISTSQAWKDYTRDIGVFHIKATMTGGSTLNLTDSDFMMGSVSFTDSMSGMSEIALGAVVTNTFNATLNNFNGRFDNWDWNEIEVWFGIEVNGTEEWIHRGIYTIDRPNSLGNTIKIECYDYMDKLNKYFAGLSATLTYPVDSNDMAEAICTYCNVDYGYSDLSTFNVAEFEIDESTTCRQVLMWVLQTDGLYARINPVTGELDCKKWNILHWSTSDTIEGGIFDVWNAVANTNGGTLSPWSVVTDYNGGTFFDGDGAYSLERVKRQTIMIEDVEVTGIRAYAYNTVDEFAFDTAGSDGYIIALQDNPLITEDNVSTVASRAWANVDGLKVRPFDSSIFGDPSIEAGDTIILKDYKGNYYVSVITNMTFNLGGDTRVSCDAETPVEKVRETANPVTSAIKGATMAAYDYIIARKIAAEAIEAGTLGVNGTITTNDLEVLNGSKLGGFNIANNELEATYVMPHTYTASDATRIRDILLGSITPTDEDYELFDLNGDGEISALDYVAVNKAVQNFGGVISCTIVISPTSYSGIVKTSRNTGGEAKLGAGSVVANQAVFSNLNVGGNDVNDFGVQYLLPSGDWRYMKHSSGKLEMWMRKNYSVNVNQAYGSLYFGHIQPTAYPTATNLPRFIETPSVVASVESGNDGDIFIGMGYGSATTPPKICCYCATTYSGSVTLNIHAVGRWK